MKIIRQFTKNNKGFTLIELIVSISIIAIISSIMLANFRVGGASEELNAAAQNLVSEIRKAQSYALSYKEFNGSIQNSGGWGIRLTDVSSSDSENVIMFFDTNNSGQYDSAEDLFSIIIGKNTRVTRIFYDGINLSNRCFSAIFYPPDPKIMLRGYAFPTGSFSAGDMNTSVSEVKVVLEHISGKTKTIVINRYGLVDVN